jgi:hypothetical protein
VEFKGTAILDRRRIRRHLDRLMAPEGISPILPDRDVTIHP